MVDCSSDHGGLDQGIDPDDYGRREDAGALIYARVYSYITPWCWPALYLYDDTSPFKCYEVGLVWASLPVSRGNSHSLKRFYNEVLHSCRKSRLSTAIPRRFEKIDRRP